MPFRVSHAQKLFYKRKQVRIDVKPTRGEQLQKMAKEVMTQPPEVLEQIKKLLAQ